MTSIPFDWTVLEEIRPFLFHNALGSRGQTTTIHLPKLRKLVLQLGASDVAQDNAARLATGYDDRVVILLEPSNKAEREDYHVMKTASTALQAVDETLAVAFAGQRDVDNTIFLDRRSFRSAEVQSLKMQILELEGMR